MSPVPVLDGDGAKNWCVWGEAVHGRELPRQATGKRSQPDGHKGVTMPGNS